MCRDYSYAWDATRDAIVCLDPRGHEVWAGKSASYALDSEHLVSVTHKEGDQELIVYRLETGEITRREPCNSSIGALLPDRGAFVGSVVREVLPSVYDQAVQLVSLGDRLRISWEVRARKDYRLPIEQRAPGFDFDIACDSERAYVGRGNELVALDLGSGNQVWATQLQDIGGGPTIAGKWLPAVSESLVVVNLPAGTAAFSTANGERRWLFPKNGGRAVYEGCVYIVDQERYYVLDLKSGVCLLDSPLAERSQERWRLKNVGFSTHLAISETHGYVGDYRGRLHAFERETGDPVWMDRPEGITGFSGNVPVIAGNRLYISSFSMDPAPPPRLYCYEGVG